MKRQATCAAVLLACLLGAFAADARVGTPLGDALGIDVTLDDGCVWDR